MTRIRIVGFESCFHPDGIAAFFWSEWIRNNVDAPVRVLGEVDVIDCYHRHPEDCRVQLEYGGSFFTAREVLKLRVGL